MQALHLSCVCALCIKPRVWTMEYNYIFKSLRLILCFMFSLTKCNTAYVLIAQIVWWSFQAFCGLYNRYNWSLICFINYSLIHGETLSHEMVKWSTLYSITVCTIPSPDIRIFVDFEQFFKGRRHNYSD